LIDLEKIPKLYNVKLSIMNLTILSNKKEIILNDEEGKVYNLEKCSWFERDLVK
jgi:hypothetical protein